MLTDVNFMIKTEIIFNVKHRPNKTVALSKRYDKKQKSLAKLK